MADVIAIIVEVVKPQCSILQQLADVIARWQMEWPPQAVFVNTGRCYLPGDRWTITTIELLFVITFPIHILGVSKLYRTFSSDLRKPCCKLTKACLLIQSVHYIYKSW